MDADDRASAGDRASASPEGNGKHASGVLISERLKTLAQHLPLANYRSSPERPSELPLCLFMGFLLTLLSSYLIVTMTPHPVSNLPVLLKPDSAAVVREEYSLDSS